MKKKTRTYFYLVTGILIPYTVIVEPLPCPYCSGKIKIPKFCKPPETKND